MVAQLATADPPHNRASAKLRANPRLAGYFSRVAPGTSTNYGAMCEQLAIQGRASELCRTCDGTGARILSEEQHEKFRVRLALARTDRHREELREEWNRASDCGRCRGTGFLEKPLRRYGYDKTWTTVRCWRCKGSGEVLEDGSEEVEDVCPTCAPKGAGELTSGYRVPATAKETGSSRKGKAPRRVSSEDDDPADAHWELEPASKSDEIELSSHGELARLYQALRTRYPVAAAALEAFDGPDGDRWATTKWGRLFALWPLTKPGQKLIRHGREASALGHGYLLSDLDVLASERGAEESSPTPDLRRRSWIREADRDARNLLARAHDALAEVERQP